MPEFSLAEENYLKAIYHLSHAGTQQVNTNAIAEKLQTKPASVSDMIRRLSEKGVLTYVKYQGVNITDLGKKQALWIIRKHRLWEVFLVSKLGFHWDEVHEIAEQLEHIKSSLLISRLDEFLGYPKFDPHGDPIPDANGVISSKPRVILSELQVGEEGELVSMKDTGNTFLNYLDKIKLTIGTNIKIIEIIEFDGSREIKIDNAKNITISQQVSDNLLVVRK
jgi:DtxR family Mn-dependent transcriptional regulator